MIVNLNKKLEKLDKPAKQTRNHRQKKWFVRVIIGILLLLVIVYLPARNIYLSSKEIIESSRNLKVALKNENFNEIKQNLTQAKNSTKALNRSLGFFFWLDFVPFIGQFSSDARHLAKAFEYELEATTQLLQLLEPYQQELGFISQPTPGQDRVAQLVKIIDKSLPFLDKIEPNLKKAKEEVEDINLNKYPQNYGQVKIRSLLELSKNVILGSYAVVGEARPALKVAPSALGQDSTKTYLLLFQNNNEIRATGGFLTAYAFLQIDKGRLTTSRSDDIYKLDEKLLSTCLSKICPLSPPEPIVKYLPEASGKPRTAWSMRDSNLSPDIPTSMREFERMYELLGEGLPFDGIILMDTKVVEELIKITGPIDVFGTQFSAEGDKRCDCPNVIFELENYATVIAKGQGDRKAILGTLMQQILARSLGAGADKVPDFINTAVKLADEKHLILYMHDKVTQEAMSQLNWTGEIKHPDSDYLHINDSNFAGGKSNIYVEEKVDYDIKTEGDDNTRVKLSIEYKNPKPARAWLNNTIYRDYVRVYVPLGSKLESSKGSDAKVATIDNDLGYTVFESFLTVRPANLRVFQLEYTLPTKPSGKKYDLFIQKQPGTKDSHYTVKINGKKMREFNLTSDKKLQLDL